MLRESGNSPEGGQAPRVLYRIKEFAEITSLSQRTVYELIHAGQIKAVKVGRSTRITRSELDRFVAALENAA